MVSLSQGTFRALPFDTIMDRATGRVRVPMVDIHSDRYMIARRYMLRLRQDDFDQAAELEKLAKVLEAVSSERFTAEFRPPPSTTRPLPRAFYPDDGGLEPSVPIGRRSIVPK